MKKDYLNTPEPVVHPPKRMSYSEVEKEIDQEIEDAVIGAFDNLILLSSLTFKLGTKIVNDELNAIAKKYKL